MKFTKVKTYGFFDTETHHIKDMEAEGMDIRVVGSSPHIFINDVDTGERPRTWVKCASLITVDADTRKENRYYLDTVEDLLCAFIDYRIDRAYSHNYRFDGSFIISYLFEGNNYIQLPNGWTVTHDHSLMGKRGIVYEDTLIYTKGRDERIHKTRKFTVHLRDSAKIWNSKLSNLAESFGLKKGDEALSIGVNDAIREYCMMDSEIIKTAIMWYIDKVAAMTNGEIQSGYMTSASTAYGLGMYWLQHNGVEKAIDMNRYQFNRFCEQYLPPVNEDSGFPSWMRKLYKGATPLLDKTKVKKLVRLLRVYDVNSMYPYQLIRQRMPIGFPQRCGHPDDVLSSEHLWFAKICIVAHVKDGHRATYLDKCDADTLMDDMSYLGTGDEDTYAYITNKDFDYIQRDYDIEYLKFIESYEIGSYTGLFKGFIEYWYDIKKNTSDSAMKAFSKLIINSFYGKFGTREEQESCEYEMDLDGCLKIVESIETRETSKSYYLPLAIWTTAYARDLISFACNTIGWEHVVYTDTDSLHIIGLTKQQCEKRLHEAGIGTTSTELGDFKDETKDKRIDGIYIRNKGYFHFWHDNGALEDTKMAGSNEFPGISKVTDVLGNDSLRFIQRRGYRVKGGILIMEKWTDVNDSDNGLKVRLRKKGMTELQTALYIESEIDKARHEVEKEEKAVFNEYGCPEDARAYLEDCEYKEEDRYFKNRLDKAYRKKIWEDMRDYD